MCATRASFMGSALPSIPAKRYFTIGEVADLCAVKPHVLRYWEQEFTQLRPMKRRGNRRYYQHHEVLMIRRIRDLLYDQGFTISGARNQLQEVPHVLAYGGDNVAAYADGAPETLLDPLIVESRGSPADLESVRRELFEIRGLLSAVA